MPIKTTVNITRNKIHSATAQKTAEKQAKHSPASSPSTLQDDPVPSAAATTEEFVVQPLVSGSVSTEPEIIQLAPNVDHSVSYQDEQLQNSDAFNEQPQSMAPPLFELQDNIASSNIAAAPFDEDLQFDDGIDAAQAEANEKARDLNIEKINQYLHHFPDVKKDVKINPKKLETFSSNEIADILHQVQLRVQHRNTQAISAAVFNQVMFGVEKVACSYTPLKLQGFALAVEGNQAIQDSLIELQIQYLSEKRIIDPKIRLAMGLLTTAGGVHLANCNKEALAQWAKQTQVSPDKVSKFRDL
jgi:hypothetical protein